MSWLRGSDSYNFNQRLDSAATLVEIYNRTGDFQFTARNTVTGDVTSFPNFGERYRRICPVTWTTTETMIGPAVALAFLARANWKKYRQDLNTRCSELVFGCNRLYFVCTSYSKIWRLGLKCWTKVIFRGNSVATKVISKRGYKPVPFKYMPARLNINAIVL